MQIVKLDHVNIRTTQMDSMIDWYSSVLGLRPGERPDFPFPGAWLYVGENAVVHLVAIDGVPGTGAETELKLEHFAFSAAGSVEFEASLKAKQIHYRRAVVPTIDLIQINLWDPDGNHVHVDFPAVE